MHQDEAAHDHASFHEIVTLTPQEVSTIRAAIEHRERGENGFVRRSNARFPFPGGPTRMTVTHPGGGVRRFIVHPVNISSGGMCVIHGGFLHQGSIVTLELVGPSGVTETIGGRIAWCVLERHRAHSVGIRFDRQLDVRPLVDPSHLKASMALAQVADPSSLTGRVIAIEDQDVEGELLRITLSDTSIDLTVVSESAELFGIVAREPVDVILCDLNLHNERGEDVIMRLRTEHFTRPIVVITSDTSVKRATSVREVGANEVITKPFEAPLLIRILSDLLSAGGVLVSKEPLVSTLSPEMATKRKLTEYVARLHDTTSELRTAISAGDFEKAKSLCQTYRVTAGAYGFPLLLDAATKAIVALDASQSTAESRDDLLRVVMVVERLQA